MKIRSVLIIAVFLIICGIVFGLPVKEKTGLTLSFVQDGKTYHITGNSENIWLERKPFSIRYYGKAYSDKNNYAAQIAVLEHPEDTFILKTGQKTAYIPYFEPGTGLAPGENGRYDTLHITNSGHHYLYYQNEQDKRVNLISKKKELLELDWPIAGAFDEDKIVSFQGLNKSTLYFVVFIDHNLNEVTDEGEIKIISVNFK